MTEQNKNINSGSGYFYLNKEKQGRQPDFKGKVNINGKDYLASMWWKKDKNDEEFLSVALTDPNDLPKTMNQNKTPSQNNIVKTEETKTDEIKKEDIPNPDFGGDTFFDSMFKE